MTGTTPGKSRIEWVRGGCRLLGSIAAEFARTRPFDGLTIGTGIHLEPKTVALLLTLAQGGARVVSTGNLSSTQADAAEYLRARGVEVIGAATTDQAVHDGHLRQVIATRPHLLLDNGGDLFAAYLAGPYPGLLGGTEETTSGRMRLRPLAARIGVPVLVINDSPIKQAAENRHAVGQSVLESYLRITNRMTNGRQVAVFGYGACGKGVAASFRNAYASVAVVEIDPVPAGSQPRRLRRPGPRGGAPSTADVVITVTGAESVITADDLRLLKDGVILLNAGHFPREIAVARAGRRPGAWYGGTRPRTGSRRSASATAGPSTCWPAGTWPTWRARARWAIPSSRWTSGSPCRHAAWRQWRPGRWAAGTLWSRSRGSSMSWSPRRS